MMLYQVGLCIICFVTVVNTFHRPYYGDRKIYTFAFPAIEPGSKFNGKELVGPRVELMKEVCCRASKRCEKALVDFTQCYNGDNLSPVLNGRWYDVCVQLVPNPRRRASYSFSDVGFFSFTKPAIVVRPDSNITLDDLRDPRNDIKVAFVSNPELVTSFFMQKFLEEFFTKPENQLPLTSPTGSPSATVDQILKLINDPCSGVDVGLIPSHTIPPGTPYKLLGELNVESDKASLMVRKDDQYILDWWDFTLKRFMCSPDYKEFCDRLDKEFGVNPLNCPDASQVDCSKCTYERRVPACGCR